MRSPRSAFLLAALALFCRVHAAPPPAMPWMLSPEERERIAKLTDADHADMMAQLGIRAIRPGPNASNDPGTVNPANYDQLKANPYPDYPDPLTLRDGSRVTTPAVWWERRRPEIVEDFEREVLGRIPAGVPGVTWRVERTLNTDVGGVPVLASQMVGHVVKSGDPSINVDIRMAVVLPAHAQRFRCPCS